MVSFILPAYKAKFLAQAIQSILNQSETNFELVIIDDASPENIKQIVDSFSDERITYYRNNVNIGGKSLVDQWNHCIKYAKGDYIVLAADDDLYHIDFLDKCLSLAKEYPQVDIIRTGVRQIDESNNLIGIDGILPEYCSKYQFLYYWINATAFTCIGNYMFKTEVLTQKKFIDFPYAFCSDAASCIAMAENGIANTAEMLFDFRISSIHLSSSKNHLIPKLKATTLFYTWLMNLNYSLPTNELDQFCYSNTQRDTLYAKCKYDYYNQVIKYLPFSKLDYIKKCELLNLKDKLVMGIRYFVNKILNK
ncbi:TPA: glycosyltransferase family 2 protein [Elizabethkingia anophelis]